MIWEASRQVPHSLLAGGHVRGYPEPPPREGFSQLGEHFAAVSTASSTAKRRKVKAMHTRSLGLQPVQPAQAELPEREQTLCSAVVRRVEPATGARHGASVRVGDDLPRLGLGLAVWAPRAAVRLA